jgi:hypothetical protein
MKNIFLYLALLLSFNCVAQSTCTQPDTIFVNISGDTATFLWDSIPQQAIYQIRTRELHTPNWQLLAVGKSSASFGNMTIGIHEVQINAVCSQSISGYTHSYFFEVTSPTQVNVNKIDLGKPYPNPFTSKLVVPSSTFIMYNYLGKIIYDSKMDSNFDDFVLSLPTGTYMISIGSRSYRIVKN